MTVQQKTSDSALPVVVTVAQNVSAGGRSSADDSEGGSLDKIYIYSQPMTTITTTTYARRLSAGSSIQRELKISI